MDYLKNYQEQGYELPDGWTAALVVSAQRHNDIPAQYMPLAVAGGAVAWGVPMVGGRYLKWRSPQPCTCYVSYLPEAIRFVLRYGAHEETCPVYRPSADPVDRENDTEYRERVRIRVPQLVELFAEHVR